MPELFFKGKEFVYNHHLAVPHRPLVPHPERSIGTPRLDGNLIIHGDNLHALKALLPLYAGKVDCIFIDPPYNTGNEGWCYNDNDLGASTAMHLWLIYTPDLAFLRSRDAALTLSWARAIAAAKPDKPNLVFAAARFVSQRILSDERLNVELAPLPFALYRVERT